MAPLEVHLAMGSVILLHFLLGEEYVPQSTAIAVGITQLILCLASLVVGPVLRSKQKEMTKLTQSVGTASWHLAKVGPQVRRAVGFVAPGIGGIVLVFVCAHWLRQSGLLNARSLLFGAPVALALGALAHQMLETTERGGNADANIGDDPYDETFWSDDSHERRTSNAKPQMRNSTTEVSSQGRANHRPFGRNEHEQRKWRVGENVGAAPWRDRNY